MSETQKEKNLIARLSKHPEAGAQHLSYDGEKGIWEFRVPHFTKWGEGEDSDEEEEEAH